LTPNVAAMSSASPLVSHACATRSRRSIEYGAIAPPFARRSTTAAVLCTSRKRSNAGPLCPADEATPVHVPPAVENDLDRRWIELVFLDENAGRQRLGSVVVMDRHRCLGDDGTRIQ